MKMSGEETIPAPIKTVWKALNDPAVLQKCIPGCEKITMTSATTMTARVVAKVGPVKAGFNGTVELKDLNPPHSYRIEGKGEGGLAGFATGGASVKLEEVPEGTRMSYDVDAQIGGKLAMLGSRLIDSTARSMAEQFFTKFAAIAAGMKPEGPASKPKPAKKSPAKAKAKTAARKPVKKVVAKKTAKPANARSKKAAKKR
jgi:uncharacterized protein